MQRMNARSGLTCRPNRNTPRFAATKSAGQQAHPRAAEHDADAAR